MKKLLPFLFIIFIFSCKDATVSSRTEVCGVKDPVRNLPWLKAKIDSLKTEKQDDMLMVTVGKIKDEYVFDYTMTYMSCHVCVVYRCDGSRVDLSKLSQTEMEEFVRTVRGEKTRGPVIWPEK
ncbi:MAG: hypothetical protein BGO21_31350 [Dyadobacter sp. 50-39]|uniref:hypothetical protein n=1 Tax=Dyadobacter sp. 50-39 TaxID=1895756 RepID=UPI0009693E2E|nr:hypothetical protein [Dyadobacter sp. 50-39]OJV15486.1 MAG: hypothetical protein BGO21_31350 [Dyadobacter sp. 50-39]